MKRVERLPSVFAYKIIILTSIERRKLYIELKTNDGKVSERFALTEDTFYLRILKTLQALGFSVTRRVFAH